MENMKLHALEFSLSIGCPMDCEYCPQKLLLNRYYASDPKRVSRLGFDNFKLALSRVRKGGGISFAGMSEPFLNRDCADMIVFAHQQGYKISLLTTIVGMTERDYGKIKNIPFESLVLHIPDRDLKSKIPLSDEYMNVLELVVGHMNIDYYSCHGTPHASVAGIIDKQKYAGLALSNRAGNLELENFKKPRRKNGRIVCYHGSEQQVGGWAPVMLPDGTLVLCCQDYGIKHPLGNLFMQTWEEIESSREYQKFKLGLEDDSIDILCRDCVDAVPVEELPSIKIGEILGKIREGSFKGTPPRIFLDIANSEIIGVYGLGKFFSDHFFQEHWDEGLKISVLSDKKKELYGRLWGGYKCISPEELREYEDITVIAFVKNISTIREELRDIGIRKVYFIEEVISAYEQIIGKRVRW